MGGGGRRARKAHGLKAEKGKSQPPSVLPVVFGAFVLHGSVKRDEVVGEGEGGENFNRVEQVERVEGGVVGDSLVLKQIGLCF